MEALCEFSAGGIGAPDLGDEMASQSAGLISTQILRLTILPHVIVVHVQAVSKVLRAVVDDLNRIARLEQNWDSYGGAPVARDCIIGALEVLAMVLVEGLPGPIIVPTSRGGVQLEWHCNGADLEIEILSRQRFHVSYEDQSGRSVDQQITTDLTPLSDAIQALRARA